MLLLFVCPAVLAVKSQLLSNSFLLFLGLQCKRFFYQASDCVPFPVKGISSRRFEATQQLPSIFAKFSKPQLPLHLLLLWGIGQVASYWSWTFSRCCLWCHWNILSLPFRRWIIWPVVILIILMQFRNNFQSNQSQWVCSKPFTYI